MHGFDLAAEHVPGSEQHRPERELAGYRVNSGITRADLPGHCRAARFLPGQPDVIGSGVEQRREPHQASNRIGECRGGPEQVIRQMEPAETPLAGHPYAQARITRLGDAQLP